MFLGFWAWFPISEISISFLWLMGFSEVSEVSSESLKILETHLTRMFKKRFESVEKRLGVLEDDRLNCREKSLFSSSIWHGIFLVILASGISYVTTTFERTMTSSNREVIVPQSDSLKLNLGSGSRRFPGYLNIDKSDMFEPDIVWDLESFPWPFRNDTVEEINLFHILEHLGASPEIFMKVIQELYRISKDGAKIHIVVPHPSHSDFISDPTHVRAISFDLLLKFSKESNRKWIKENKADTPFALLLDVDFEFQNFHCVPDKYYLKMAIERGIINSKEANNYTLLYELSKIYGNLVKQISLDMVVRK